MSLSDFATPSPALRKEVARRRSFAIISHPDAGKTTLTEKFLLYGGALNLAGSVTARKNQRATTSDWMELEKQRGISVSSTVLQFEYKDCVVNILDTPGHKDFSEDTYRVLTAVDAAVMVVDAGKGIEAQTRKLFEVCRRRGVPIFTFMNKLDRPARPTLDLLDELESVLGIAAFPVNWPLGDGPRFKGVYDREHKKVHLFERTVHGSFRAPVNVSGIEDQSVKDTVDEITYSQVCDELRATRRRGRGLRCGAGPCRETDSGFLRFRRQQLRRAAAARPLPGASPLPRCLAKATANRSFPPPKNFPPSYLKSRRT